VRGRARGRLADLLDLSEEESLLGVSQAGSAAPLSQLHPTACVLFIFTLVRIWCLYFLKIHFRSQCAGTQFALIKYGFDFIKSPVRFSTKKPFGVDLIWFLRLFSALRSALR
jgi:hypothetical protein